MLEDSKGKELDVLSGSGIPDLSDVVWSPTEENFAFAADVADDKDDGRGLYAYSIKERKRRLIVSGSTLAPEWSADGRFLICLKTSTPASEKLRDAVRRNHGTIIVLHAHSGFKPVLTAGKLAGYPTPSPTGTKIAFMELLQDEYGDFDNHSLQVTDIATGRIQKLLTNRREPLYIWAGDNTVAATTYDKYAVPTLSLVSLPDGTERQLVTARDFAGLEPLAYLSEQTRIIYKAAERLSDIEAEELWAVEAGRQPLRLFPQAGRGRS